VVCHPIGCDFFFSGQINCRLPSSYVIDEGDFFYDHPFLRLVLRPSFLSVEDEVSSVSLPSLFCRCRTEVLSSEEMLDWNNDLPFSVMVDVQRVTSFPPLALRISSLLLFPKLKSLFFLPPRQVRFVPFLAGRFTSRRFFPPSIGSQRALLLLPYARVSSFLRRVTALFSVPYSPFFSRVCQYTPPIPSSE